jgi:uncharacterized phage protein (predicted DNA packaging)
MNSDLNEIKQYLNIYESDHDDLVTLFIEAAESQILKAGVTNTFDPLYKLAVMMYVQEYYDNRGIVELPEQKLTALNSIILLIRDV